MTELPGTGPVTTGLPDRKISILYEDNHLLVVEKPVNLPSQADESGDPDLLSLLKSDLKRRYGKPGNVFLGLVHRLDRPVGGVMVFAKTSKAAARLGDQIRRRELQKKYLAVLHGVPEPRRGRLQHYLVKDHLANLVTALATEVPRSKPAVLDYEILAEREGLALAAVHLETGRSHQIRVQFAAMGHPLYGDQKYGSDLNRIGQQLALWSVELGFKHPTRGELLIFHSRPPQVFPWSLFPLD